MFEKVLEMFAYRRIAWDVHLVIHHSGEQLTNIESIQDDLLFPFDEYPVEEHQDPFDLLRT